MQIIENGNEVKVKVGNNTYRAVKQENGKLKARTALDLKMVVKALRNK